MSILKKIELYCNTGGSDKVYNIFIDKNEYKYGVRHRVYALYGKRDTALKTTEKGTFTTYWQAESAFKELVKAKWAKGYKEFKGLEIKPKPLPKLHESNNVTVTVDLSTLEGKKLYNELLASNPTKPAPAPPIAVNHYGRKFKDV